MILMPIKHMSAIMIDPNIAVSSETTLIDDPRDVDNEIIAKQYDAFISHRLKSHVTPILLIAVTTKDDEVSA